MARKTMRVVVATDGSKQSLAAAKHLISFADPAAIESVSVVGVVSPYASVAFADEISGNTGDRTFREAAEDSVAAVAAVFDGWGPAVRQQVLSGSPANEIVKAVTRIGAGLVVVAAGSRGLSATVLLGSTAQRVQHSAPCPVLVVRPAKKKAGGKK